MHNPLRHLEARLARISYDSNCDSALVWNTLTSSKLQTPTIMEKESSGGESDNACYMVQGNDSLEVYSESQLDNDDASSSSNDYIDANALNLSLIHI